MLHRLFTGGAVASPAGFLCGSDVDLNSLTPSWLEDERLGGMWMSGGASGQIEILGPGVLGITEDQAWLIEPISEPAYSGMWMSSGASGISTQEEPPSEPPPVGGLALGVYFTRPPATKEPDYVSSIGRFPDVYRENLGGVGNALFENNNWTWIANPEVQYDYNGTWAPWLASHPLRRFFWMVGMCPRLGSSGGSGELLSNVAAGERDTEWRSWADYCATNGFSGTAQSPIYIALGWEMDSTWPAWGCQSNATLMADFKAAWRRIVDVVRARQPAMASTMKWCFCPSTRAYRNLGISWAEALYPGDSYVDLIGGDFYDNGAYSEPPTASEKINVWNTVHLPALQNQNTFADNHGKPQFWGEWACVNDKNYPSVGGGGDDNPNFIQQSYNWATTHDYEFVNYFDANQSTLDFSLRFWTAGQPQFTNARATFISTFGQLPHPWE